MTQTIVRVTDSEILLRTEYANRFLAKEIIGAKWDAARRAWVYPLSPLAAEAIVNVFELHTPELDALIQRYEQLDITNARGLASKNKPLKHQEEAFAKCVGLWDNDVARGFLVGHDMGCGKTYTAIALANYVNARRVFVACPLSVVPVWLSEFLLHSINPYNVVLLDDGSVASRTKRMMDELQRNVPTVIVTNHEAMWREPMRKVLLGNKWDLAIADEIHRLKAPSGKASRFAALLRDRATYRLGLTGTPMPHSPLDIYSEYRYLEPAIFGTSFTVFKARYAIMGGYGGYQVIGYRNQKELHDRMMSIAHIVKARDVLDLPDAIHQQRYCTLPLSTRKIYDRLEQEFYAQVESGEITISNALVKLLRLQQVTSGFIRTDDGDEKDLDNSKATVLREIFEDLPQDEPVVVFAKFHRDLDRIGAVAEQCGRTSCELSGRTNQLDEWADGAYNTLAAQIQAGSVGVSFVRARVQIYYSLGFSLGDYQQSLARILRPGQKSNVLYIHVLAKDTVDQHVYKALQKKLDVVEYILGGGVDKE